MQTRRMSFAQALTHKDKHPDRTASRPAGAAPWYGDVEFRTWTSRAALLTTLDMQGRRPPQPTDWRPLIKRPN